jgi:hypothetical protein
MFNPRKITKGYRRKEFSEIPTSRLMNFLSGIPETNVFVDAVKQEKQVKREIGQLQARLAKLSEAKTEAENALTTWEDHFRSQKIPYVITTEDGIKTLWKERRV